MDTNDFPLLPAPAPRPSDEPRRLERLRALGVVDTPPEAFSDAAVSAAASIANTPMAALSLIDSDRAWFKATCGLGAIGQAERDLSFCAYTVLGTTPLVVDDARLDPRFGTNPYVAGSPRVRFYAGFPIIVRGQPIGALCVFDDRPRLLSGAQSARLAELAAGVSAWMVRRGTAGKAASC